MSYLTDSRIFGGYYGKLKVYGWIEEAGTALDRQFLRTVKQRHHHQARCIVAAPSQAAAARAAGRERPSQLWNLSETGNVIEAGVALNQPGVVFWRPLDQQGGYQVKP